MIKIKNVNLCYPGNKMTLKNIDLNISKNECVLICGESGSGKSTLISLINGIATRYENCEYTGEVLVKDRNTKFMELYEISREISSVFQNPKTHFFNVDTTAELLFYLENRGFSREEMQNRINNLIKIFPIKHLLNRSIFDLSGGEKQILSIASAYISGTEILILDEPSSNLDKKYTKVVSEMLERLKQEGITIIIAEHRLSYLRKIVDRIIYMENGEIIKSFSNKDFFDLCDTDRKKLGLRNVVEDRLEMKENVLKINDFNINKLSYYFPKANKGIDVKNLGYPLGSIVGIVGENGSGKSSFIASLTGLKKAAITEINIDGTDLSKSELIKKSGYVMQDVNHQLFTDSVYTEVTLNQDQIDEQKVDDVLKELGLWEYRDSHPMSLSGGQKQRVAIATVILTESNIICFDEPTSGMDYRNMKRISKLIKSCSTDDNIIFIISHDYEFLNELVDYIMIMEKYEVERSDGMLKKVMAYGESEKSHFNSSVIYMIISTIAWISAFFGGYALINGFLSSQMDSNLWMKYSIWIVVSMILYGVFKSMGLKHSHIFAYSTLAEIRKQFAEKMVRNPLGFTLKQAAGSYRQKIVDNVEQIEILLAHILTEGIPHTLAIISLLLLIFFTDYRLGLLAIIPVVLSMILMMRMIMAGMKEMVKYHEAAKNMSGNIVEYIEGIEVIKIFNQKDASYEKLTQSVYGYRDFTLGWYRRSWNTMAIVAAVAPTMTLFIFPVSILMFRANTIELSNLIFVSLLCFSLATSIPKVQFFMSAGAQINKKIEDLEKDFQSMELKTGTQMIDDDKLDIEFKNVYFAYDEVEVLKDCSFSIAHGEKVALVGESGSGKSTLVKLLMHYYDVKSGDILIGGRSISKLINEDLMDHISYVSQDNFLFDISIRDNILLGKPDATDEELIEAAKAAQIHDFIMGLEHGYDTNVGDSGSKLSGGERQRICIARAMIKGAPIVVLDEATSFTDPENEYYIDKGIASLCEGKTVITIAHKLSRIIDADKIILVNEGKIEAVGTHEELLKNDIYNSLWNRLSDSKKFQFDVKEGSHA